MQLDILASVPPIPVAASSSREAVDGAQVEGHSVEVHIANSRQSLVTGNYDVGTQGDTATNIRFLSSSPGMVILWMIRVRVSRRHAT